VGAGRLVGALCFVSDVRASLEHDGDAGEHVMVQLSCTLQPSSDLDATSVARESRAGADVHVAADDHVAGDRRVGMHERAFPWITGTKPSNSRMLPMVIPQERSECRDLLPLHRDWLRHMDSRLPRGHHTRSLRSLLRDDIAHHARSSTVAIPCPTPTHMVASA